MAMTTRQQDALSTIKAFAEFLTQDGLRVGDVVARVGNPGRDPGPPQAMEIQSLLPGVRAAHLSRYPESGDPYVLALEFQPDGRPKVLDLKLLFGEWRRSLAHGDRPPEIIFYPPPPAKCGWEVAVIATLADGTADIAERSIRAVAFRRDRISESEQGDAAS